MAEGAALCRGYEGVHWTGPAHTPRRSGVEEVFKHILEMRAVGSTLEFDLGTLYGCPRCTRTHLLASAFLHSSAWCRFDCTHPVLVQLACSRRAGQQRGCIFLKSYIYLRTSSSVAFAALERSAPIRFSLGATLTLWRLSLFLRGISLLRVIHRIIQYTIFPFGTGESYKS